MKLLFDHNPSYKLVATLEDIVPASTQTRLLGLGTADEILLHSDWKNLQFDPLSPAC